MVSSSGFGAFETGDGSGVVRRMASGLEAELVSFVHRVRFRYAMHYDRARAAAVLLTTFAKIGLTTWSPPEDATAPLIEHAFRAYFQAVPTFEPAHRQAIEADVAELVRLFAAPDVIVSPPQTDEVHGALRAIGAEPDAWLWARPFGSDFADAWTHCDSPPRRIPQVALAAGVDDKKVLRAIAAALLREAKATRRSRLDVRHDVVQLLGKLAGGGASSAATRKLTTRIQDASKAEEDAVLTRIRALTFNFGDPSVLGHEDPLQGVLFQTAELTRMFAATKTLGAWDPYQAGDFVEKLVRDAKATNLLATFRAELEPALHAAAKRRTKNVTLRKPSKSRT
jgi:hypothetical protein